MMYRDITHLPLKESEEKDPESTELLAIYEVGIENLTARDFQLECDWDLSNDVGWI